MSESAPKTRSVGLVRNATALALAGLASAATGCRNDDGSQTASTGQAQAVKAQAIALSRIQGFHCDGLVENGYVITASVLNSGQSTPAPENNAQPATNSLPPESSSIALDDAPQGQAEKVPFLRVPQAVLMDPNQQERAVSASSCGVHEQFLNTKLAAAKQATPQGALDWYFAGDVTTRGYSVVLPGNQGRGLFAKYPATNSALDDIRSYLRAGFDFRDNQIISLEIEGKKKHMVHLGVNLLQLAGGGTGVEVELPAGTGAPTQAAQPGAEVFGPAGSGALPAQGKCVVAEDLAAVRSGAVFAVKADKGKVQSFNVQVPTGHSWEIWADGVAQPICTGSKSQVVSYHFSKPGSRKLSLRGKKPSSAGGSYDPMVYKLITVNVGSTTP